MFKINLSASEKRLLLVFSFIVIFFLYWYLFLNPLLIKIDRQQDSIRQLHNTARAMRQKSLLPSFSATFEVYPRDEQVSRLVRFASQTAQENGIDFISLNQFSEPGKITMEFKFYCKYTQLLDFLNAFSKLHLLVVIDNIAVVREARGLLVDLRVLSGSL